MSAPLSSDGAPQPLGVTSARLRALARELARDPASDVAPQAAATPAVQTAEALVADLAARLRPACAHLSDADFAALVLEIARTKLRWAAAEDEMRRGLGPPPTSAR